MWRLIFEDPKKTEKCAIDLLSDLIWYVWMVIIDSVGGECILLFLNYHWFVMLIKWFHGAKKLDILKQDKRGSSIKEETIFDISLVFDLKQIELLFLKKMSKLSFVILTVFLVTLVAAQEVVREKNDNDGSGNFRFTYGLFMFWYKIDKVFIFATDKVYFDKCSWNVMMLNERK